MHSCLFGFISALMIVCACGSSVENTPIVETGSATDPRHVVPGDAFAVIGEGSGPDDGGGYKLILGIAAAPGTGHFQWIGDGRNRGTPELCRFEVSSALIVEIEDRKEFRSGSAIELPYRSTDPGKADWLAVLHMCGREAECGKVTAGRVRMDSLQPGNGARGHYQFATAKGPLEGDFRATWCGATTRP